MAFLESSVNALIQPAGGNPPLPKLAWSEMRYTAYCFVMPKNGDPAHSEATSNRDQFSASPQEFRAELKLARHAAVHGTNSSRKQAAEIGVKGICVEALERKGIVIQHVEGFQAQL